MAELHGLRKDMAVYVRKLSQEELTIFTTMKEPASGQNNNSSFRTTNLENTETRQANQEIQRRYQELVADRVEVTVRDQFASRRDMWHLVQSLDKKTIFKGN